MSLNTPPLPPRRKIQDQDFSVFDILLSRGRNCPMLLDASIAPFKYLPGQFRKPPSDPCAPIVNISNAGIKGLGLFVERDIPAGTRIIVEQPLLIVPVLSPSSDAYQVLIPHLSSDARDEFFALSNRAFTDCAINDILATNAVQVDLPTTSKNATEYGGIFPVISRANHSCDLSTTFKWDLASFSASLYTNRIIRAGEEITNQYVDVLAPRAERRAQLARYGFICDCTHCNVDDATAARSDAARAELRDWDSHFMTWVSDLCAPDDAIIAANRRALMLIAQEGLQALQVPFLEENALSYALLGDEPRFREWAKQVMEACTTQDPECAAEFSAWMACPRTFRLWGWRAKRKQLRHVGRR